MANACAVKGGSSYLCGFTDSSGMGGLDGWIARLSEHGVAIWQLALGGGGGEQFYSALATDDGGCIVAGYTSSFGAGATDGWIVRLDAGGVILWQKTYGGPGSEAFTTIARSPRGFYVGGAIGWLEAEQNVWVLEIDGSGEVLWQKTIEGDGTDDLRSIAVSPGGFVFTANSNSALAGRPGDIAFFRPWVVSLDPDGEVLWSKSYNHSGGDAWNDIASVGEDGFVVTGEVLATAFFRGDLWIVRLDAAGDPLWDERLGDNFGNLGADAGWQVRQTADDGFLAAGLTETGGAGFGDMWLVKVGANGAYQWDRTYGSTGFDHARAMTIVESGKVLLAGWGQFPSNAPFDALAFLINPDGSTGANCNLSGHGAPSRWTSPLDVDAVQVEFQTTGFVPAGSAAIVLRFSGGIPLCGPPSVRAAPHP